MKIKSHFVIYHKSLLHFVDSYIIERPTSSNVTSLEIIKSMTKMFRTLEEG